MVGQAIRRHTVVEGLQPFDPARDVGQVADLLRDTFAGELGPDEALMLRDMAALRYVAPLLWAAHHVSPAFRATFGGFVWVEGGRVVGNASLTTADEDGRYWIISNVAVAPEYRRRGIATELVQAAIEAARERGGQAVTLRVSADNRAAQSVYQKLGFQRLDSMTHLWLDRVTAVPGEPVGSYHLRPWDRSGNRKAHELGVNLAPAALRRMRPLRREHFSLPPQHPALSWLLGLLWGRTSRGWAIEEGGRYLATLVLAVAMWRGHHNLELLIGTDLRGRVEGLLVSHALSFLSGWRSRPVEAQVRSDHHEAIERLQQHGFVTRRVLDVMGLELVPRVTIKARSRSPSAG